MNNGVELPVQRTEGKRSLFIATGVHNTIRIRAMRGPRKHIADKRSHGLSRIPPKQSPYKGERIATERGVGLSRGGGINQGRMFAREVKTIRGSRIAISRRPKRIHQVKRRKREKKNRPMDPGDRKEKLQQTQRKGKNN